MIGSVQTFTLLNACGIVIIDNTKYLVSISSKFVIIFFIKLSVFHDLRYYDIDDICITSSLKMLVIIKT